jgi:peptide/nickel transport system substrate-binding protein
MRRRRHAVQMGAMAAVMAMTAAACGGSDNGGSGNGSSTGAKAGKGGTLNILLVADFEHLDPQRNYVGSALNFGTRLLYRTLTAYQSKPGADGSKIVPDLATDLGRPSNGSRTWEFTLKDGLKYEDGSPIVCADLKHGVERSFSSQITDGPQYAQAYLADAAKYKGPYVDGNNGGKGLTSVTCKNDKTIVYQLAAPVGDFNYTVTLPQFSPVPKAKDTNVKYDDRPFSSGPYKVESYTRDKQITLVRNENWDPETDTVRKALPDKVVAVFGLDPSVIDQRMMADAPADQSAIMLDSNVQAENIATVSNDPVMKKRLIVGLSGFTRYLAINTAKVKDLKVRQAIEYAIDKESYRGTRGGKDAGDFATSMITPLLTSYKKFDVYPAPPTGDQGKARALLQEAGALGTRLKIDIANTPQNAKSGAAFKEALDKAGFKATINPINPDVFYSTIGKTSTQNELTLVGWGPDWTNGSSVITPLFNGKLIAPEGNNNYAQLNDPAINQGIADATQETDLTKQATLWGELDQKVLEAAAVVPLIYDRNTQLEGSRVTGGFLHSFFGQADLATLGVS